MTHNQNSAPLRCWIHGATGRMGREILQVLQADPKNYQFVGGSGHKLMGDLFHQGEKTTEESLAQQLARTDVIIDFSNVEANIVLLEALSKHPLTNKSIVIGTTGLAPETLTRWRALAEAKEHRILFAPNTSLGVLLTTLTSMKIAEVLRGQGFDIEIIESHHREKADAPSGTAKFMAEALAKQENLTITTNRQDRRKANELGVSALRGGLIFGEHEICFLGDSEELRISHRALSRSLFAKGAVKLVGWLTKQKPHFYQLLDIPLDDLR